MMILMNRYDHETSPIDYFKNDFYARYSMF